MPLEKKDLLFKVVIEKYPRLFLKSNNVRPKYYELSNKTKQTLPLKYTKYKRREDLERDMSPASALRLGHEWKLFTVTRKKKRVKVYFLIDSVTKERVISNPNQVGKPSEATINGQKIYQGGNGRIRQLMMEEVHKCMMPRFKDIKPLKANDFPVRMLMNVYDTYYDKAITQWWQRWDVDNRTSPFIKAIPDILEKCNIFPDDHRGFMTGPPAPLYTPIEDPEKRKIVLYVYRDTRKSVEKLIKPEIQEELKKRNWK